MEVRCATGFVEDDVTAAGSAAAEHGQAARASAAVMPASGQAPGEAGQALAPGAAERELATAG